MMTFQAAIVGCITSAMLGFAFALFRDIGFAELLPRLGVLAMYGGGMAALLVWLNGMLKKMWSDEGEAQPSRLDG